MKDAAAFGLRLLVIKLFGPFLLIGGIIVVIFGATMFLLVGTSGSREAQASECPVLPSTATAVAAGGFTADQLSNTTAIVGAAKSLGMGGNAGRLAVITAVGESDLTVVDYGDAAGPDSRGLFQQRDNGAWGSYEDRMNPTISATNFLKALGKVAGWESLAETEAIHRVQGNADPTHYTRFIARGDAALRAADADIDFSSTGPAPVVAGGSSCGAGGGAVLVAGKGDAKDDYPYKDRTPGPGVYVADPFGYFYGECTSWSSWAFNRDHGGFTGEGTPKFSMASGNFANGNAATWKQAWLDRGWPVSTTPQRGAVAWWGPGGGEGIGEYGHVGYVDDVLPDGRVLLSEYNNSGLAPPGHKFSSRTVEPQEINAYLLAPAN